LQEALDDFEPRTPKVVSEPQEKIAGTLASVIAANEATAISCRVFAGPTNRDSYAFRDEQGELLRAVVND
jgi:hypothetical protein